MAEIIDCTFNSVWDGGFTVATSAKFNVETGEVTDIEISNDFNGDHLECIEREYIDFPGRDGEFDVSRNDDDSFVIDDLAAFQTMWRADRPR